MPAEAPERVPALVKHRSFHFILGDQPLSVADQLMSTIMESDIRCRGSLARSLLASGRR
jgi:hypothetical protein